MLTVTRPASGVIRSPVSRACLVLREVAART